MSSNLKHYNFLKKGGKHIDFINSRWIGIHLKITSHRDRLIEHKSIANVYHANRAIRIIYDLVYK